jgi:tetratricopeptide (TPR) repeat protein
MQQPIFITGRVLLEDGTPPPQFAVLETVCGANPHSEGYTDGRGYFSIELGRRNGVLQDASESSSGGFGSMNGSGMGFPNDAGFGSARGMSGPYSEMRYANCDLRARLAGYRSQVVSLANRRPMDNPDIGIILLHRLAEGEGTTVSANMLAAPKDARKAYEKGMEALKKHKPEDATKNFQKAVKVYPDLAPAWFELGRLQLAKSDQDSARKSFETSAKADPKYVPPLVELALFEAQTQNWQQVLELTDQAAKLDSFDYPQVFFFNAVANYNLHNIEAAEKSARQAERLDTRHSIPKASHLLGVILAQRKDYAGAAEEFRSYLKFAPSAPDAAAVRTQLDQVEKLTAQSGK